MKTQNKKHRRVIHRKPSRSRAITRKPKPQQQPLVVYKQQRQVELSSRQVDLIKSLCAKDANLEEFEVFMQIAKSSRLDPFKKEIYCLIFHKDNPEKRQMVIITGIDGYRAMAARDHKDFGGADAATFTFFDPERKTPAQKRIPESATVTVKDTHGGRTTATVWWEELAPKDLSEKRSDFWNRMPKNQLEKCAEAKGIRKRFPGRGNIFIREELDQALQDLTPEGRQIHTDGVAPSGAIVDRQLADPQRQNAIASLKASNRWCEKHQLPKMKCPADEHTAAENEAAYEAERAFHKAQAKPAEPVKGDEDKARADAAKNVTPKQQPAQKAKPPKPNPMAGNTLVNGTLVRVIESRAQNGAAVCDVQISNTHYKCFHKSMFANLQMYGRMGGFNIQAFIDKHGTIAGLQKLGPVFYEEDGKTEKKFTREPGQEG